MFLDGFKGGKVVWGQAISRVTSSLSGPVFSRTFPRTHVPGTFLLRCCSGARLPSLLHLPALILGIQLISSSYLAYIPPLGKGSLLCPPSLT